MTKETDHSSSRTDSLSKSQSIHVPFLDGMRGVAILAVFFYHSLGAWFGRNKLPWDGQFRSFDVADSFLFLSVLSYGEFGVAVFFVISGFCIHLSFLRNREKGWFHFFNRRFFRIYPTYLIAAFAFSIPWMLSHREASLPLKLFQIISHALALHNLDPRTFYTFNASFWSIAVELQLYAIYPAMIWISNRWNWAVALGIAGGSEVAIQLWSAIALAFDGQQPPTFIAGSPFAFWFSWAIGAQLCNNYIDGKKRNWLLSVPFPLIGIAALLAPLAKISSPFSFMLFALATAVVIERLLSSNWRPCELKFQILHFGFESNPLSTRLQSTVWAHLSLLGTISYSFYLIHQPIVNLTRRFLLACLGETYSSSITGFACLVLIYPPIFAISYVMFRSVELPSVQLGKTTYHLLLRNDK